MVWRSFADVNAARAAVVQYFDASRIGDRDIAGAARRQTRRLSTSAEAHIAGAGIYHRQYIGMTPANAHIA